MVVASLKNNSTLQEFLHRN